MYKVYLKFLEDSLSIGFVSALVLLFIICIIYLVYRYSKAFSQIKIDTSDLLRLKPTNPQLLELYNKYFNSVDSLKKTEENAFDYFNYENITSAFKIPVRSFNALPGVFIAIGVLGTFTGLAIGLTGVEFYEGEEMLSPEQLSKNLEDLVQGVQSAFITSIAGMFLSILFTIIYRLFDSHIVYTLDNISISLNNTYLYTKSELKKIDKEDDFSRFTHLLTAKTPDGKVLTIGQTLMNVQEEAIKQSKSLASFSDDLAFKIEATFESIMSTHNENFRELVATLVEKFDHLSESLASPAEEMANSVGSNMQGAIKEMMEEMRNTLSEGTRSEMDLLRDELQSTTTSLRVIPDTLSELMNLVTNNVENTQSRLLEAFNKSSKTMHDSIASLQENQQQLIESQNSTVVENARLMHDILASTKDSVNQSMEESYATLRAQNDKERALMQEQFDSFKNQMNATNTAVSGNLEHFSQSSQRIIQTQEESITQLTEHIKSMLSESSTQFSDKLSSVNERMSQGQQKQQELVQEIDRLLGSFSANIEGLNKTTEKIAQSQGTFVESTQQMKGVSSSFERIASTINTSITQLSNMQTRFADETQKMLAHTSEVKETIEDLLKRSAETKTELVDFHTDVRDSLNDVFDMLNARIQDYQNEVNSSLKGYLDTYTANVGKITSELAAIVDEFNDAISEAEFGELNTALATYNENALEIKNVMISFLNGRR